MPLPAPKPLTEWCDASPGDVLAIIQSYEELLQVIRARLETSGISFAEADEMTLLADNYTSKIMARVRNLGPLSLTSYLGELKLKLVVVSDGTPRSSRTKNVKQDRHPWSPDGALLSATGAI